MARIGEENLHKTILLFGDVATKDGRIYPLDLCKFLAERMSKAPELIIQEFSPQERKLKKIPLAEPWKEKSMATVIGGEMEENALVVYFRCKGNRDGKKLEGMINQEGIENLQFIPVGYGLTDDKNVIQPGYQLNYIAVEALPKKPKEEPPKSSSNGKDPQLERMMQGLAPGYNPNFDAKQFLGIK